jgi:hypothetical protein
MRPLGMAPWSNDQAQKEATSGHDQLAHSIVMDAEVAIAGCKQEDDLPPFFEPKVRH